MAKIGRPKKDPEDVASEPLYLHLRPRVGRWIDARRGKMSRRQWLLAHIDEQMAAPTGPVCHILREGLALCGAGMPQDWPAGQRWASDGDGAKARVEGRLCPGCAGLVGVQP